MMVARSCYSTADDKKLTSWILGIHDDVPEVVDFILNRKVPRVKDDEG